MSTINDQAVVVRLTDFSETSQIVTVITARSGQVRLIAKGIRKSTRQRFAAGVDLLELGDLSYSPARGDSALALLTGWEQRENHAGLRRELPRLYAGVYLAEIVVALTEEFDPHPGLFAELAGALAKLCGDEEVRRVVCGFQRALLVAAGYAPRMSHCVDCGRPRSAGGECYFSSQAGGLVCGRCEIHHVEKSRLPRAIWGDPGTPQVASAWMTLLNYHISGIVGRPLRTFPSLLSALG